MVVSLHLALGVRTGVDLRGLEPRLEVGSYVGGRLLPEFASRATYRSMARAPVACAVSSASGGAGAPGSSCSRPCAADPVVLGLGSRLRVDCFRWPAPSAVVRFPVVLPGCSTSIIHQRWYER